jgi:translocator protein
MKQKINFILLALWILSFEILSYTIGFIARSDKDWYNSLVKSTHTPSPQTLATIWPFLYAILGAVGYFVWQDRKNNKILFNAFAALMIMSWSWSPIFFGLKMVELSYILLAIMLILSIYVIYEAWVHNKIVFCLLLPYLCWLCFHYYLNTMLFIFN